MRIKQKRSTSNRNEAMKRIQINLKYCEAAQELLSQTARELKAYVILICEIYKTSHSTGRWVKDENKKTTIWTCGVYPFERKNPEWRQNFGYVKIKRIHFYSCCPPPSAGMAEYKQTLDSLIADIRGKTSAIVVEHFNEWAVE